MPVAARFIQAQLTLLTSKHPKWGPPEVHLGTIGEDLIKFGRQFWRLGGRQIFVTVILVYCNFYL